MKSFFLKNAGSTKVLVVVAVGLSGHRRSVTVTLKMASHSFLLSERSSILGGEN